MNDLFKKTEKLLHRRAWEYSHKYGIPFEEVQAQAFYVFTEAVIRFDKNAGASFITFLYWRLNTLADWCEAELRTRNIIVQRWEAEINEYDSDTEYHIDAMTLPFSHNEESGILSRLHLELSMKKLSPMARKAVKGILSGEFHRVNKKYNKKAITKEVVLTGAMQRWGWTRAQFAGVWKEIRYWYNENIKMEAQHV